MTTNITEDHRCVFEALTRARRGRQLLPVFLFLLGDARGRHRCRDRLSACRRRQR